MKEYKAIITKFNGDQVEFRADIDTIKKHKNISNLIFKQYNKNDIKKIDVELWNEYTKKHFLETTYDEYLERLKDNRNRVEITFNWGENTIKKSRCYIGKSTGWIPCYLEIKRSDSSGGGAIITRCIKDVKVIR